VEGGGLSRHEYSMTIATRGGDDCTAIADHSLLTLSFNPSLAITSACMRVRGGRAHVKSALHAMHMVREC
jgi:hypothetical protein